MSNPLKQKDDEQILMAITDDSWYQGATKSEVTDFDQSDKDIKDWRPVSRIRSHRKHS